MLSVCVYIYIYIYIERERERERDFGNLFSWTPLKTWQYLKTPPCYMPTFKY